MDRGDRIFKGICLAAALVPLSVVALLLGKLALVAAPRLTPALLTQYSASVAERSGILPGLVGTLLLLGLTTLLALPVGIGSALYLEEFSRGGVFARLVSSLTVNLASVPSVIYGMLGLSLFVHGMKGGQGLLSAAATLALLVLPTIIIATREALARVPRDLREAAFALGASHWAYVRKILLPLAMRGILTGAVLSLARTAGETAPLILVGAVGYVTFLPDSPQAPFTTLTVQIFNWVSRPDPAFAPNAAAGILILLALLFGINSLALALKARAPRV